MMEQFATIKDAARYLESKLTDPDAWVMTDHTFSLKERPHIELWTSNGALFFGMHQDYADTEYIFGWKKFWCYFKFWWYVMRPMRKAAALQQLNKES